MVVALAMILGDDMYSINALYPLDNRFQPFELNYIIQERLRKNHKVDFLI